MDESYLFKFQTIQSNSIKTLFEVLINTLAKVILTLSVFIVHWVKRR